MSFFKSIVRKFYFAIWKRIFSNEIVVLFEMKQPAPVEVVGLSIQPVTDRNVLDASTFQNDFQLHQFQTLMTQGNFGFYGYLDGRCVHRSWALPGPAKAAIHPLLHKKLSGTEIFIHYCETSSQARGKNIFTAVLSHIGRQFALKKILICASLENTASIRSIKKSGFIEIERIHLMVFFGVRFVKSLPPQI